jgi:hypothetical protein
MGAFIRLARRKHRLCAGVHFWPARAITVVSFGFRQIRQTSLWDLTEVV